ncbi:MULTISPECIES: restriction endonuclease [unclassified Anabaena]|uniref:restriction endonuclease n=1 Tax=unclassified Anabaena TaxID=2619674 RepID=UPI001445907A|nr:MULTISPECIES: restriction endonuclease [unclassified Anabaena]MTJ08600.1 restriction endonuclease [Anabaena sp. UHCC 0204]MTJ53843.1 restriction endonuclease [Anabaena sp. UHCC 0253]
MNQPIQKIIFGSPGTGKSYRIVYEIIPKHLQIYEENRENIIKTVFHPEYTYGDFMGKLVPITRKERVEYKYYEGHFLKALSKAYKNIVESHDKNGFKIDEPKNVALVIDEINRGNSSAIFGTVFQLLDRDKDGWSSYGINITELEFRSLLELMGVELYEKDGKIEKYELHPFNAVTLKNFQEKIKFLKIDLENRTIWIPPNLSILGTMNTSDNSIFFMDSAFKRRWDWEFVNWDNTKPPKATYGDEGVLNKDEWKKLQTKLNNFIKSHHASIRGIEDKQIGYYFIKEPITSEQIQNKLMFFLWDSVFNRDKKPLVELLKVTKDNLVTFGDFTKLHNIFVENIMNFNN